jgi:hypothetical protein
MDLLNDQQATALTEPENDLESGGSGVSIVSEEVNESKIEQMDETKCQTTNNHKNFRLTLIDAWKNHEVSSSMISDNTFMDETLTTAERSMETLAKYPSSYRTQFIVLLQRALKNSGSQNLTYMKYIETLGVSLICGLVWFQV